MIIETDTNCDVRFFGGKYERSVLPKNLIKPITTNMESLHVSYYNTIFFLFNIYCIVFR